MTFYLNLVVSIRGKPAIVVNDRGQLYHLDDVSNGPVPGNQTSLFACRTTRVWVMVRLITHNLLACHAKGCTTNNFPLKFSNVKLALREADFNPDFLRGFLSRIEWDALIQASREVKEPF
jgi:hypothetical protein